MLSALRVVGGRRFAVRGVSAVRAASTWANVPQGPPVRVPFKL